MIIDPTAIIGDEVELGENVEIGAYSVLKGKIKIGSGTVIKDHVVIYGPTTIGKDNVIHPGAVVGNISQDLKYKGEETEVIIGDKNSIREYVTIQQGTTYGGLKTVIGNNNLIMGYSHIAHDCILGNNIIMANTTQMAGHVVINDYAYIGGLVGIHQFVTVGRHCFVGFMSRLNRDVPPFVTVEGNPATERIINQTGLKRRGFSDEDITLLRKAFQVLYISKKTKAEKTELLNSDKFTSNEYVKELLSFIEETAKGKNGRALEGKRGELTN